MKLPKGVDLSRVDPQLLVVLDRYRRTVWVVFLLECAFSWGILMESCHYLGAQDRWLHASLLPCMSDWAVLYQENLLLHLEAAGTDLLPGLDPTGFTGDYLALELDRQVWEATRALEVLRGQNSLVVPFWEETLQVYYEKPFPWWQPQAGWSTYLVRRGFALGLLFVLLVWARRAWRKIPPFSPSA